VGIAGGDRYMACYLQRGGGGGAAATSITSLASPMPVAIHATFKLISVELLCRLE
jgi:hypothetical protein